MSLTIFEGPDGAGKTTLIEAWARRLKSHAHGKAPVIASHGPYLGEAEIAHHYLRDCVAALRGYDVLMDRSWLSEEVYGPIARGMNRLRVPSRRMLERVALAGAVMVVRCQPPFETCRANYLARKHLEYLPDDSALAKVYAAFASKTWELPNVMFDYTIEPSKIFFVDMAEQLRRYQNPGPGVGRFSPASVLLVGEQVSEPTAAAHLPFVSDDPAGCTAWLSERLEEWDIKESSLYWVNALSSRGHATPSGPWLEQLAPKRVVALGAVAKQWCDDMGITAAAIPHPQFWRRFHHSEPYPLKELLS